MAALIIQLVAAGIPEIPGLINAIVELLKAHPAMTPDQVAAFCQSVAVQVRASTLSTDAKLDAVVVPPAKV